MVCDARYLYYAQTNVSSNIFFVRYDTTTPFQELSGYTSFNFTSSIDSNVSSVYQILSTGNQLIALTNTPGTFYVFSIYGNFSTDWTSISYGSGQITEGVLIGPTVYFLLNNSTIITYSKGQFTTYFVSIFSFLLVAVKSSGSQQPVMTSTDGINWNPQSPASFSGANVVAYGNGLFVAFHGGSSPHSFTSVDGVNWTPTPTDVPNASWNSIVYGNGLFVAVAYDYDSTWVVTSPDGINWTPQTAPNGGWRSVTYGNGLFVAVAQYGSPAIMTSPNGVNWTYASNPPSGQWYSVTYGNGLFVATTPFGAPWSATSSDGNNWTTHTALSGDWESVTYGNGLFVAVTIGSPYAMVSSDGVNWSPAQTAPNGQWESVTYGNGLFVALGSGGQQMLPSVMTSPDGINWTPQAAPPDNNWKSITNKSITPGSIPYIGTIKNLHAFGSTIYASANTSSSASIIQIDTTQDLSTSAAYQYYTSGDAPITFAGPVPSIFANGPRFLYIFTNDPSQSTSPQNAIRYDPYPTNTTLQASIIADYKILPPGVPKPTWAEIKYVQSQHVTAESFADLQILGPVKELIVTGTANVANVYQYSNLDGAVSLTITGNEEIITPDVGTVTGLGVMAPFQTHTVLPVRNLSVIPFEIDPESLEPNGTINFSRLLYQNLSNGASVWATSYNILRIEGGLGGLKFNSPY
jgi:hypothetical protein